LAVSLAVLFAGELIVSPRVGAQVQQFSSGSTGTDGALNITAPGVTYLDPKAMNINPKGDNIFNFTTITIANGSILKISEVKVHGPVYFLASGDVNINGVIDLRGDDSPGPTVTAAEQIPAFAGSGGYSGGLGGVHADANHQALPGNGPGGGAAGDINSPTTYAVGGSFTANRFLVPLVGGSGGGGTNDNTQYGAQGGAGGGGLLIATSTTITLSSGPLFGVVNGLDNGAIYANGGSGGSRGCGGAAGAVRLVANSIVGTFNNGIVLSAGGGAACMTNAQAGFARVEANSLNWTNNISAATGGAGSFVSSLPFSLNLPTTPPPVITVTSINGVAINANPFSFPDTTINSAAPVPVVVNATNIPLTATVTLFLLSDTSSNQSIPVTLQGTAASSAATVQVTFPSGGTRGLVKAAW
jgi:hypothetical protein